MGLVVEFIVTATTEFFGWLVYDVWKEGRDKRRKRRQRRKQNGPIDYG